jgi:hypothetical protein
MKKIFPLIFALLTFSTSLSLTAQPRRPGSPAVPTVAKVETTSEPDPLNDFAKKGLPEPYVLGLQPSAALARSAAAKVLKYDEDSLPVLIAIIQKAGFHIIDKNQKILFRPTDEVNGMAFFDFEVVGMLRSATLRTVTTIDKIGKTLAGEDADLKRLDLSSKLLTDLRQARSSKDAQTQFLATVIFELGRGASDLATATPAQARINLMQASLIERRYLSDLVATFEEAQAANSRPWTPGQIIKSRSEFSFVNASWPPLAQDPCDTLKTIEKVQGYESKGKKVVKMFGGSVPSIANFPKTLFEEKFKKLASGFEKINTVMAYVKLIMANLNIESDVQVEDPMPYVRTEKMDGPGKGERLITAKFRINFTASEEINCTAKALKITTGLELEVPDDGPLKEVPLHWEPIYEGKGYSRYTGYPLRLMSTDPARGDISKQKTDANGQNKIKIMGEPQSRPLAEPLVPQAKNPALRLSVATEDMDAAKDIPKIIFGARWGIASLIEFAPDLLAKMALKSYKITIPVRDWQPCSEDWGGYINYRKKLQSTIVVKSSRTSNGNSTGDGVRRIEKDEEVNVVLNPRTPEQVAAKAPTKPADFRVRGRHSDIFDGLRDGDPCCGPAEGSYRTKFRTGSTMKFFGTFQKAFYLRVSGGDRDYAMSFDFGTDPVKANIHKFTEIVETSCPLEYAEAESDDSESVMAISDRLPDGRYGSRFLNDAGDLLQGSKEVQGIDGSTITWDWALARCKRQ